MFVCSAPAARHQEPVDDVNYPARIFDPVVGGLASKAERSLVAVRANFIISTTKRQWCDSDGFVTVYSLPARSAGGCCLPKVACPIDRPTEQGGNSSDSTATDEGTTLWR